MNLPFGPGHQAATKGRNVGEQLKAGVYDIKEAKQNKDMYGREPGKKLNNTAG